MQTIKKIKKSLLKFLVLAVIYFGMIFLMSFVRQYTLTVLKESYTINFFMLFFIPMLLNIIFGIVLNIENLIETFKSDGCLRFNFIKTIVIGLPCILISLLPLLVNSQVAPQYESMSLIIDCAPLSQVLFGYILGSSLYKLEHT